MSDMRTALVSGVLMEQAERGELSFHAPCGTPEHCCNMCGDIERWLFGPFCDAANEMLMFCLPCLIENAEEWGIL